MKKLPTPGLEPLALDTYDKLSHVMMVPNLIPPLPMARIRGDRLIALVVAGQRVKTHFLVAAMVAHLSMQQTDEKVSGAKITW